jgi:hypothetical protein
MQTEAANRECQLHPHDDAVASQRVSQNGHHQLVCRQHNVLRSDANNKLTGPTFLKAAAKSLNSASALPAQGA